MGLFLTFIDEFYLVVWSIYSLNPLKVFFYKEQIKFTFYQRVV